MKLKLVVLAVFSVALMAAPSSSATVSTLGSIGPAYSGSQGCSGCDWFQASVSSGPSYAAPADGTVIGFKTRIGDFSTSTESVAITVVRPLGGGQYKIVHETAPFDLSNRPAFTTVDLPTWIPVQAGDTFGVSYTTSKFGPLWTPNGGTSSDLMWGFGGITPDTPWTPSVSLAPRRLNLEILFDDGVEPAPTPGTGAGAGTPVADTTAPAISGLKSKNTRFKVRSGAPASIKKGTAFKLTLSEAATVKFALQMAVRKRGKTTWKNAHSFSKILPAGPSSTTFSGSYKSSRKTRRLKAGRYRVVVTATDAAGNAGSTSAKFTVVAQ